MNRENTFDAGDAETLAEVFGCTIADVPDRVLEWVAAFDDADVGRAADKFGVDLHEFAASAAKFKRSGSGA